MTAYLRDCSCPSCECVRLRIERDAAIARADAATRVVKMCRQGECCSGGSVGDTVFTLEHLMAFAAYDATTVAK